MIAPSILNANNMKLGEEIQEAADNGITRFHLDIMDGHFVPNLSYGPELVSAFKKEFPKLTAEVHLMSNNLPVTIPLFVEAGADLIEFHLEATDKVEEWLDYLHAHHVKAGLAISPETPVEELQLYLNKVDQILVMSVKPGFGGQSFNEKTPARVKRIYQMIKENNLEIPIEVDGGIDDQTIKQVKEAGAKIFVAGSYIFKKGPIKQQIQKLEKAAN
ncbi:ribulose-phosphate 3-epimerase [Lactobacillus sp. PV037]|uniref:ribulose-phosphate 3-epimerase n=1 Tax=Lactobacillus sp. PV037 TaxID=2594496 RepID=UPI0022402C6B|nr:ribulose-phosphate 3-epimerase [Lactobacillus sp. PV037]QNQ83873.1 ribulose-phosphate 3-epimerase [Lactobacillus sp. PV037]